MLMIFTQDALLGLRQFLGNESPLQLMKNTFYFTSKVFVLSFLSCIETAWLKILPNILRSKGNQTMKFGGLLEYNMRTIFIEKSYPDVVEKIVPDHFLKKEYWAYVWINSLKFYSLFLLHAKLSAIEIY